jgi:hypothetical protein
MGMFDEVLCNHELFGIHRGETHQTKDLHWLGGLLDNYEITPSGRLEFLEYTVEDRSDPTLEGIERLGGMMTRVFTGCRRDLNYHGSRYLSCFGRAKFTDGMRLPLNLNQTSHTSRRFPMTSVRLPRQKRSAVQECGTGEGDSALESTMERTRRSKLAIIAKMFRDSDLPSWEELNAFVDLSGVAFQISLAPQ